MGIFGGEDRVNWTQTEISGMSIEQKKFVSTLVRSFYERVLFHVLSNVQLDEKQYHEVMASCSDRFSPASIGLVRHVAYAMTEKRRSIIEKQKLPDGSYIFKANTMLDEDSADVIVLDFSKFDQADILREYYAILFSAMDGAAKGVKISQGLMVYIEKLSELLADKRTRAAVQEQVDAVSDAVRKSGTGYLSDGSRVEFPKFDVEPTDKTKDFIYKQISNVTGYALSFVNGEGGSAMSDTGESDRKQNRAADEVYFNSIINPILQAVFREKAYSMKPDPEMLYRFAELAPAIELNGDLNAEGKIDMYGILGIKKEHLDIKDEPPVKEKTTEIVEDVDDGTGSVRDSA